jgi:hypothetical protein
MSLISLMLAAAAAQPAVKPDVIARRELPRARPAPSPARSKRLIELEATVKSLPPAADERGQGGPEGL